MQFAQLATVRHRVQVGAPLPFNVRNADQTLLLARGQRVSDPAQLQALFERGALVDVAELLSPSEEVLKAPSTELPGLWNRYLDNISKILQRPLDEGFAQALGEATAPVQSLIERDPDLAIFQVLRKGANPYTEYGAQRSVQCAITAALVAQRLGWPAAQVELAFKVALTMNLSMLELQGRLARQPTALTPEQRAELHAHPEASVRILELAHITNRDWLQAVLEHHEAEDGSGYPRGTQTVGELASLVRRADLYTAKLAPRVGRSAVAADQAGRQMFMQDPGHPTTAALVKEFGIYPPGCHVRLVSGELAMVIRRSDTITSPVVACLTDEHGKPRPRPVRRSTAQRSTAVQAVVPEESVAARLPLDQVMALLAA